MSLNGFRGYVYRKEGAVKMQPWKLLWRLKEYQNCYNAIECQFFIYFREIP